jgi:hypothetical protein
MGVLPRKKSGHFITQVSGSGTWVRGEIYAGGVPVMPAFAYLLLLAAIVVSILAGWKLSLAPDALELASWRRKLLLLGLLANAASLILFLTVSFGPRLVSSWSPNAYNYRLSVPVAVASILFGGFGKRVPRVLVILNGIALTWLWFNLGAMSL